MIAARRGVKPAPPRPNRLAAFVPVTSERDASLDEATTCLVPASKGGFAAERPRFSRAMCPIFVSTKMGLSPLPGKRPNSTQKFYRPFLARYVRRSISRRLWLSEANPTQEVYAGRVAAKPGKAWRLSSSNANPCDRWSVPPKRLVLPIIFVRLRLSYSTHATGASDTIVKTGT